MKTGLFFWIVLVLGIRVEAQNMDERTKLPLPADHGQTDQGFLTRSNEAIFYTGVLQEYRLTDRLKLQLRGTSQKIGVLGTSMGFPIVAAYKFLEKFYVFPDLLWISIGTMFQIHILPQV